MMFFVIIYIFMLEYCNIQTGIHIRLTSVGSQLKADRITNNVYLVES